MPVDKTLDKTLDKGKVDAGHVDLTVNQGVSVKRCSTLSSLITHLPFSFPSWLCMRIIIIFPVLLSKIYSQRYSYYVRRQK